MASHNRDWYLSALGVVRYIPRETVAQADGNSGTDVVDHSADVQDRAPAANVAVAEQSASRHDQDFTGNSGNQQPEIRVPATAGKASSSQLTSAANDEESVHFRLGFWQPSPQLVVLSAMPSGIRPDANQQQMLTNLLKAIQQLPGNLASAELIDWPLSPGTSSALSGARELLDAFLDVKAKLQPFSFALLMGSMTVRLVAEGTANIGDKLALRCKAQGIVTHSLHDMSADTKLKRETWEAIRFLAQSE
jgi:hypothetical protein